MHIAKDRLRSKEQPRRVSVDFTTWRGTSIGAKHWYVDIQEERDAVWNEERQSWVTSTSREDLRGLKFSNGDFAARAHAKKWAEMIVEENFSPQTHEIVWEEDEDDNMEAYRLSTPGRF